MTPKDKAWELFSNHFVMIEAIKYSPYIDFNGHFMAKKCALISVDEILKSFDAFMDSRKNFRHELEIDAERYWKEVKQEIENL